MRRAVLELSEQCFQRQSPVNHIYPPNRLKYSVRNASIAIVIAEPNPICSFSNDRLTKYIAVPVRNEPRISFNGDNHCSLMRPHSRSVTWRMALRLTIRQSRLEEVHGVVPWSSRLPNARAILTPTSPNTNTGGA